MLSDSAPLGNGVACTLGGHTTEGFALSWSNTTAGRLLTGDCDKNIILWDPVHFDARQHTVAMKRDGGCFVGHQSSVEDLQWSPTEENVFASCSSDQTVRIWDARRKNGSALGITAHNSDVNVISWNP
jgi:ribosome assembly protein RRB1